MRRCGRRDRFIAGVCTLTLAACSLACPPVALADSQREIRFYHSDHLGSTTLVTDERGQVVQQIAYTPHGQIVTNVSTDGSDAPHKFTGQRADASTGLYYYKARYYDPSLGRFTQPDTLVQSPADPQTLNRYTYARNNPVKYIDPSGHSFWKIFKRVYLALLTFGASETIPLTTKAIVSLSGNAGVDARYTLALYSAALGAITGGIGWGLGAAISGAATSFGTSLAMASGEGREITRKVAKEFYMDIVGMSPQAAYTAASLTVSTAMAATISLGTQSMRAIYKKVVTFPPKTGPLPGRVAGW